MKIFFLFLFGLTNAYALNCNSPPQGQFGPAWWKSYSAWCRACGGSTYQDSSGGGCRPGPNWGGGSGSPGTSNGGSGSSSASGTSPNAIILQGVQQGIQELFRPASPEELAAKRQQEFEAAQARIAAEIERQRLLKIKNDKMDADAKVLLSLTETAAPTHVSDEDLLRESAPFDCAGSRSHADDLKEQGLKRLDINIGKTRKMMKQAEEGSADADKEAAGIAGELVAGKLADKFADFAKNQDTLKAMQKQLQGLRTRQSVSSADTEKLAAWLDGGIQVGNGVIDAYQKTKAAKAFNFSDPKNGPRREQILNALSEFNSKFMADTGAWEMAGEHLSATLGPAGSAAFKTAVLGIKVTVNRGSKMISENDLNEQKYHLGNMMKERAELAQKIKNLEKQISEKCP